MDRDSKRIWLPIPWRKLSFFQVIFFSLFFILFISSTLQVLLYNQGINRSLNRWESDRFKRLEKVGLDYILKNKEPRIPEPYTIFDEKKRPLISNRKGMMMMMRDHVMFPLKDKRGELLGYISTRMVPFKEVEENRELLNSLLKNLLISALISLFLSLILSYFISKRLSNSAIEIKEALNSIISRKKFNLDVTGAREIVEIGEGVKDLANQLEKEEELRAQWLHDISHDLKTPVTALKTQFESMIYGILPIDKERIGKNNKEVLRLEALILSMNELMKVETPDLDIKIEKMSVTSLFEDLKDRFDDSVANKNLTFSVNENIQVKGDRSLLFKAVSNLIDNAIKYSDDGADIKCIFDNKKITVSNSGNEISAQEKNHLFDRLYRGDSSRNSEGSGLGLSIVKAIILKHKWDITVESNNGINSFIISII